MNRYRLQRDVPHFKLFEGDTIVGMVDTQSPNEVLVMSHDNPSAGEVDGSIPLRYLERLD